MCFHLCASIVQFLSTWNIIFLYFLLCSVLNCVFSKYFHSFFNIVLLHGTIGAQFSSQICWEHFFCYTYILCKNIVNVHCLLNRKYFSHALTCSVWDTTHYCVRASCCSVGKTMLRQVPLPKEALISLYPENWLTFKWPVWYLNFST